MAGMDTNIVANNTSNICEIVTTWDEQLANA